MPGVRIAAAAGGAALHGMRQDLCSSSAKGDEANKKWSRQMESEYCRKIFPGDSGADSQRFVPGLGWSSAEGLVNWWEMTLTTSLSIYWYEIYPISTHTLTFLSVLAINTNIRENICLLCLFRSFFEQQLCPKCSRTHLLGLHSVSHVLTTWQMLLHTTLLLSHISPVKRSR